MKPAQQKCDIPAKVKKLLKSRGVTIADYDEPLLRLKDAWNECIKYRDEAYAKCKGLDSENEKDKAKISAWEDEASVRDGYSTALEDIMYRTAPISLGGLEVLRTMVLHEARTSGMGYVPPKLARTFALAVPLFCGANSPIETLARAA